MKNFKLNSIIVIFTLLFANSLFMQAQNDCTVDTLNKVLNGIPGDAIELPDIEVLNEGIGSRSGFDDYRMLFFVHGLNGDEESWSRAATAVEDGVTDDEGNTIFPAYKVFSRQPNYSYNQQGLSETAKALRDHLKTDEDLLLNTDYDRTDGMIISHSQGGLVSRALDRYYSENANLDMRRFGGMVTVCTPNQGAQLLNNHYDNNAFISFIQDLGNDLSAGPIAEFAEGSFVMGLLNMAFNLQDMAQGTANTLIALFAGFLVDLETPVVTEEYQVGAPQLDVLNEYTPRTKRANGEIKHTDIVPFYAIRDILTFDESITFDRLRRSDGGLPTTETVTLTNVPVPISLATMQYFVESPNNSPTFSSQDVESVLSGRFHAMHLDYKAKVEEFKQPTFWKPAVHPLWGIWEIRSNRKKLNAYKKGVEFMDKFDRRYRTVIGALYSESVPYNSTCVCTSPYWFLPIETPAINGECSADQYPTIEQVTCELQPSSVHTIIWHTKESDGVVLAESQMDVPQATYFNEFLLRLDGSTHMRVRNDENTRVMLESVLNGNIGDFFKTELKE